MFTAEYDQQADIVDKFTALTPLPIAIQVFPNSELASLLSNLSPETPWGDRQIAAQKLGNLRNPDALPALLAALPTDSFWMVRCAIIQALEKIGDPTAIPTLQTVGQVDSFQVVRSYATKAIERLS